VISAGRAPEGAGTLSNSRRADSFPSHRRAIGFQVISPTTAGQHIQYRLLPHAKERDLPFFLSTVPRCLMSRGALLPFLLPQDPSFSFSFPLLSFSRPSYPATEAAFDKDPEPVLDDLVFFSGENTDRKDGLSRVEPASQSQSSLTRTEMKGRSTYPLIWSSKNRSLAKNPSYPDPHPPRPPPNPL
jgi:hypothetical protein